MVVPSLNSSSPIKTADRQITDFDSLCVSARGHPCDARDTGKPSYNHTAYSKWLEVRPDSSNDRAATSRK